MQTLATTTGSEQGCEISENHISSEISQNPPLCIPDKHRAAWAFEWTVIRRRACQGSQRAASTCNRCLRQQKSLQTHFPGVFPLVASAFKAEGMCEPPHGEAGILGGLWWRWRLSFGVVGVFLPTQGYIVLGSQMRLLQAQQLPWMCTLDVRCFAIQFYSTLEWNLDGVRFTAQTVDLKRQPMMPWMC